MVNWHDLGTHSLSATAVTAATASVITKSLLFPMDTLKCRLQAGTSVWRMHGMWNGLLPKILLYSPYQAVYMSGYTHARNWLQIRSPDALFIYPLAGTFAELSGSLIRVPMETIKQRMQTGLIDSNRTLIRMLRQNPLQFYKGRNFLAQTIVHDIPCGSVHWLVYESVKRRGEVSSATAGAVAGLTTAIATNPLDVVKTRMITRPAEHISVASTVRTVMASAGIRGFYKGVLFRILHIAPNSALYMWIFDHIFQALHTLDNT